ncbi:DUF2059 domain-containing protein [Brucellaceae bacterium C25G]
MNQTTGLYRLIAPLAALGILAGLQGANAQDVSAAHLNAARSAIAAIGATEQFDAILPQAAAGLKAELIQKDPNLEELISKTVDDKAIALAARRADLETEAARAYANSFSQADLEAIASFYNSETGKKLIAEGPIVTREVINAAGIWQNGIARDLSIGVAETLEEQTKATAPAAPAQ